MSTPQEYWDACLIKTWRNMGTFKDAQRMFFSITKQWPEQVEPPLLRYPTMFVANGMQIRYFMATWLPKMNTWLWDHTPDKDTDLFKKVTKSKYTVSKKPHKTEEDKERGRLSQKQHRDRLVTGFGSQKYSGRNRDTDWNVVKGSVKTRRAR